VRYDAVMLKKPLGKPMDDVTMTTSRLSPRAIRPRAVNYDEMSLNCFGLPRPVFEHAIYGTVLRC
jgi:hypothetical protein